jgi:hypothetical protein
VRVHLTGEQTHQEKNISTTGQGMARDVDVQLGELFVSLIPTRSELHISGSREQYQQLVVFNIIKEFGFDIEVIVQVPPLVRFEINRGNSLFPRVTTGPERRPAQPGKWRFIHDCIHLGYVSNFLIIRGVPQYSICTVDREYHHQWQQPSKVVAMFVASITDTSHECNKPGGVEG